MQIKTLLTMALVPSLNLVSASFAKVCSDHKYDDSTRIFTTSCRTPMFASGPLLSIFKKTVTVGDLNQFIGNNEGTLEWGKKDFRSSTNTCQLDPGTTVLKCTACKDSDTGAILVSLPSAGAGVGQFQPGKPLEAKDCQIELNERIVWDGQKGTIVVVDHLALRGVPFSA